MKTNQSKSDSQVIKKLNELQKLLQRKDDLAYRQASKPLNFKEACEYLGFAPSYLYKLTYKKIIPHYKPSGKILFFSKIELDEWIFSKAQGATPDGGQAEGHESGINSEHSEEIREQKSEEKQ